MSQYTSIWIQTTVKVAVTYDYGPSISMYCCLHEKNQEFPYQRLSHYSYTHPSTPVQTASTHTPTTTSPHQYKQLLALHVLQLSNSCVVVIKQTLSSCSMNIQNWISFPMYPEKKQYPSYGSCTINCK